MRGVLTEICDPMTGPSMGGLQLNYRGGVDGWSGEVGERVARLEYVPVQGATPIDVPLLRLPPVLRFDKRTGQPMMGHHNPGSRWFAFDTNDSTDATLRAYDAQGRVVAISGDKLREH